MTSGLPRAASVLPAGQWQGPPRDRLSLSYAARLLRRKRLVAEGGFSFLVDLPGTLGLNDGDALVLEDDGGMIAIAAAPEPLLEVKGKDLTRLAWHIGNRHTPCQIGQAWLRILRDPVLADMLRRLGAEVTEVEAPFTPEGGAYGHGRTMGHDHGHGHGHGHYHDHNHDHNYGHDRDHVHGHHHPHEHTHPAPYGRTAKADE